MPEGDTIFRAARALHRALAGKVVTRFESVYPALTRVAEDHPIVGRTIESVAARGKHLLMMFSGDLLLHTHMRMNGSWHLYPTGARWQRSPRDMRVLVATSDAVAVGFNVPIAELLTSSQLARHNDLHALGPDLLDTSFDRRDVLRRIRARDREAVGDVLLNQRVAAGVGNVLKSETLFIAGLDPFTPIDHLADADLERLIEIAHDQLAASARSRRGRNTTRRMDPNAKLWVYGREGKPCRRCGATIRAKKTGLDARLTYWCPECQKNIW